MTTNTSKRGNGWYVIAVVVLLLVVYVGGYFVLGEHSAIVHDKGVFNFRDFNHSFLRIGFFPMGWVESQMRGEDVVISGSSRDGYHFRPEWSFEE